MGRIVLDIKDEDLLQLGKKKIKEEIEQTLKWIRMKGLLKSISKALKSLKINYEKEVEIVKKEAWKEYKKGLELRRRELLEKRPDIKEFLPEELQTSFECTPTFWEMIINFGQDVLHLSYRPEDYPPEFREKMEHYLDVVRKAKVGGEQANRELIEQSDRERYRAHAEVSRYFINNGFVEDMRASRYLVRLLLIDVGIEYIQDARLSISRNSVDLSFHEEVTKFSSETINEVRNRFFSSHGNVEFINKNQYSVPPLMNSTAETRDPENNRYGSGRRRQ